MSENFTSPNNFKIIFSKLPEVEFMTSTFTMPSISLDGVSLSSTFETFLIPGTKITFDPFTLTYFLDEEYKNWQSLYNWILGFADPSGPISQEDTETESTVTVIPLSNNKSPIGEIVLDHVFPINVESPTFAYAEGSNTDIELSATFNVGNVRFSKTT